MLAGQAIDRAEVLEERDVSVVAVHALVPIRVLEPHPVAAPFRVA
jgi:hypothetical protein